MQHKTEKTCVADATHTEKVQHKNFLVVLQVQHTKFQRIYAKKSSIARLFSPSFWNEVNTNSLTCFKIFREKNRPFFKNSEHNVSLNDIPRITSFDYDFGSETQKQFQNHNQFHHQKVHRFH